ncbi:MAG: hypothetical protein AAGG75_21480 [Bacteroidota bacterium]
MKKNLRNLIQEEDLIGHLPHGAIEEIAKDLKKGRATVRGPLKGEWVNIAITDKGLEKIEHHIQRLQNFIGRFKPRYENAKSQVHNRR